MKKWREKTGKKSKNDRKSTGKKSKNDRKKTGKKSKNDRKNTGKKSKNDREKIQCFGFGFFPGSGSAFFLSPEPDRPKIRIRIRNTGENTGKKSKNDRKNIGKKRKSKGKKNTLSLDVEFQNLFPYLWMCPPDLESLFWLANHSFCLSGNCVIRKGWWYIMCD